MQENFFVSIICPTYNRAEMLAEGLESIRNQRFTEWELVVVDDGSTDCNRSVVERFRDSVPQKVTYLYQENQGAGAARQLGLDASRGEFIALMDSDDPWLPHHLADSVGALQQNEDIDWIVAPARVINELTGECIHENSFYPGNSKRALFDLASEQRGDLHCVTDPLFVEHVIEKGFPGGLQTSVFRAWVKEKVHFRPYRLFDDNAFRIEAAGNGAKVGYFTEPHIIYRMHNQNISLVNPQSGTVEKRAAAYMDGIAAMLELSRLPIFQAKQQRMLRDSAARMAFWELGYSTYWINAFRFKAFRYFAKGISLNPTNAAFWKATLKRLIWPFPPKQADALP